MKKIVTLMLMIALVVVGICPQTSCKPSDRTVIQSKIHCFLQGYHEKNAEYMINALDAEKREKLLAILKEQYLIYGSIENFKLDLTQLFSCDADTNLSQFKSGDLGKILYTTSRRENALALLQVAPYMHGSRATICFVMVYEDNTWLIHDITSNYILSE